MKGLINITFAVGVIGLAGVVIAQEAEDVRMMRLADSAGCVVCHSIGSGSKGSYGLKPIGPSWIDVARKYRDNEDAVSTLRPIVLEGSDPANSHWDGNISAGMGMPANNLVISDSDASNLVAWILNLAH